MIVINLREYANLSEYQKLFDTVFCYFKNHFKTTTPKEWEIAAQNLYDLSTEYENTPFTGLMNDLLAAVYSELERINLQ